MSASVASWYDVLGVEPDASPEQVREAWRAGIADLDPSERRFRLLNQAAEVLLDPERRAEHDAALAADAAEPSAEPSATPSAEPSAAPSAEPSAAPSAGPARASSLPLVPGWVLVVLTVLAVLSVGAAVLVWVQPNERIVSSADGGNAIEASAEQARAVAERAVGPVLSYDYRTFEESTAAARSYMTTGYQQEYDQLVAALEPNLEEVQPVVEVEVVDSAVVRTSGDRVDVLVFVNRPTLRKGMEQAEVYKDQVTMRMVREDGEWLVGDLSTNQLED
ncbi:Chaperone protein DnaJ [Nocardioides dokdonensis FR1436]|uniref:Chaperone protein DnaJ n=1 Tax=Nocardioides dokdonensis FR1436 TaxID=1300347 RepID=A0A1A9GG13_9ACTN|nr:DnaJ domain-containing protein [Nocardioides dokdonensis]ANH37174.1 Chaperone protein DnaJ [Nocardioides dokdonensis FR1436]